MNRHDDFYNLLPNPDRFDELDYDNMFELPSSKYYSLTDFNDISNRTKPRISLVHFNLRSLSKNLDQLNEFLSVLDTTPDIIAISETKLNNNTVSNIEIPLYEFIQDNSITNAGGTAVYFSKGLNALHRPDIKFTMQQVESCWIELQPSSDFPNNKSNSIIVGCVYRHPNADIVDFIDQLEEIIKGINDRKQTVYILGDFNIDLLKYEDHKPTEDYVNMLFSYSLFPIITKPTRITSHSATLIDHIYTNSAIFDLTAGILTHDITDHLPVFCLLANTSNDFTDKAVIYYRDFSKFKKENYLNDLRNTDWDALFHKDLNITAKNISDTIQSIINKYAPMKIASRRKVKLIRKPWLTRGILKSIKHKQKLYHTLSKNPQNTEKLSQYKKYCNLLNNNQK